MIAKRVWRPCMRATHLRHFRAEPFQCLVPTVPDERSGGSGPMVLMAGEFDMYHAHRPCTSM